MACRRILLFMSSRNVQYRETTPNIRLFFQRRFCSRAICRENTTGGRYGKFAAGLCLSIPTVGAFSFGKKKETETIEGSLAGPSPEELVVKEADSLYAENRVLELYDLLSAHCDSNNDEILWRLARAANEVGKTDKDKRKALVYEAFEVIQRALQINDRNFAVHKWYAILLDYVGEYEGTKQRITNAYKVKEHLSKAIELNPRDATTIHSLGFWCFTVAELPWYQQKVASVIFATPPTSSYEEALDKFLEAERVDPDFYSMNLVMIGKTYLRLKQTDQAKVYLKRARDRPIKTEDDKKAHKEATELLNEH